MFVPLMALTEVSGSSGSCVELTLSMASTIKPPLARIPFEPVGVPSAASCPPASTLFQSTLKRMRYVPASDGAVNDGGLRTLRAPPVSASPNELTPLESSLKSPD